MRYVCLLLTCIIDFNVTFVFTMHSLILLNSLIILKYNIKQIKFDRVKKKLHKFLFFDSLITTVILTSNNYNKIVIVFCTAIGQSMI